MRLIDADALREEWVDCLGEYTANEIMNSIDDMPTVEQPMSAVEYDRHKRRMCRMYGKCIAICPLFRAEAGCLEDEPITQEAQNIVEKWVKEHPERSEE